MNWLAHIWLSDRSEEGLLGNLLGDFVKGQDEEERFSAGIRKGIQLHRFVDHFTDTHPVFLKSKSRIGSELRHYRGICIDIVYDHFLAKNWSDYEETSLELFTMHFYDVLDKHVSILPQRLLQILPVMKAENWLLSYAHWEGVALALKRVAARTANSHHILEGAKELTVHYNDLENDFKIFFKALKAHL